MAEINNKTGKKTKDNNDYPIMIMINNDNNKEERGCLRSASGGEKSARKAAFASSREGAGPSPESRMRSRVAPLAAAIRSLGFDPAGAGK